MSLGADVATLAAERVEKTAGAGPGLAVWRRLAANAAGAELRGRAILGGLRCAEATRDGNALRDLALLWRTVDEGVWNEVFVTCRSLHRAGLVGAAVQLATAEVERLRTARALYMLARLWDVTEDGRAPAAFADAIERGQKEGDGAIVHACRVRRAAWLARSAATLSEAIEEAKRVVVTTATLPERLVLARVLLRSPSRFVRAGALGMLDGIVASRTAATLDAVARRALFLAAQHADDVADELTPLELDRLVAIFSRESVTKEAEAVRGAVRAIELLAGAKDDAALDAGLAAAARVDRELAILHARARDILGGRFEPTSMRESALGEGRHPVWTALLDVVAALRDESFARAAHGVAVLAEAAERHERMPPASFTVAQAALQVPDQRELRGMAGRLVGALLKITSAPPPRGYLGLSQTLLLADLPELAALARRAAASAKEPGANEALVLALTRSAWQLAQSGQSAQARERLREARALAKGPPP